jgi:multimeric flavodoxin WrbA
MRVLGVSGSPIPNSNTDRAVQATLNATELPTEFVKLADYSVAPCRACLCCVETNRCVQADDGNLLMDKVLAADALVVGGYTPYSSLDAATKAFLERLYPGRHRVGAYRGKLGAVVVTSAVPVGAEGLPPAPQTAVQQVASFFMEEGMTVVGSVVVMGNVPCVKCPHGDDCAMSGITMLYGPDACKETVGINQFESQPEVVAQAQALGRELAQRLASA